MIRVEYNEIKKHKKQAKLIKLKASSLKKNNQVDKSLVTLTKREGTNYQNLEGKGEQYCQPYKNERSIRECCNFLPTNQRNF